MAELQVHVAGSSIAMLQGQRPPFRLLVRATSVRDGRRLDSIKPAVSDAFVVGLVSVCPVMLHFYLFNLHQYFLSILDLCLSQSFMNHNWTLAHA